MGGFPPPLFLTCTTQPSRASCLPLPANFPFLVLIGSPILLLLVLRKEQTAVRRKHSFPAAAYAVDHKDGKRTTLATNRAFEHMGLCSMSDGARRVIRGMPRWAEALRSETKKRRDLLTKLEEEQHSKDSRRKASAQQFIFEFGIKRVRRVLNKRSKATTMSEVYWECSIGFRWA